ncbi:hypothetical protein FACS1894130_13110 [Spirochaetia bacterium]|nr:hypothetical protein FACS1894130_13110 [Spirochaetia bacterium]
MNTTWKLKRKQIKAWLPVTMTEDDRSNECPKMLMMVKLSLTAT